MDNSLPSDRRWSYSFSTLPIHRNTSAGIGLSTPPVSDANLISLQRRRESRAAIMAQLPSAQAYDSLTGLVLGRQIADLPRRKSSLIQRRRSSIHPLKTFEVEEEKLCHTRKQSRSMNMVEDIENEEEVWKRRQSIKTMAASIQVKKFFR